MSRHLCHGWIPKEKLKISPVAQVLVGRAFFDEVNTPLLHSPIGSILILPVETEIDFPKSSVP